MSPAPQSDAQESTAAMQPKENEKMARRRAQRNCLSLMMPSATIDAASPRNVSSISKHILYADRVFTQADPTSAW